MLSKKIIIALWALVALPLAAAAINRQALVTRAQSLEGLKGAALKNALYTLMQPQRVLDYGRGSNGTWYGFWYTDRDTATNECINRYSSRKFYFTAHNGVAISGMNIEHSFPKSWWGGTENDAYRDLYNLYPSDSEANSQKSNYAMGVVTNVTSGDEGYDKVGRGTIDGQSGTWCWEPGDSFKGEFSRSYMYMAVVYANLTWERTGLQTMSNANGNYPGLKPWASSLYISWGKSDPVSNLERDRNNAAANLQGNRNYLIDFPNLAEYIWGDSVDVAFNVHTTLTTADDDSRYMDTPAVVPGGGGDTPASYTFVKTAEVKAGGKYLIVVNTGSSLRAAQNVASGKNYGYLYTTAVTDNGGVITLASDALAYTLEEAPGGYYLKDSQGRYYFQKGTYTNYNVTTDKAQASVWTVTPNADGTYRIAANGYYMQYSAQHSSYGCYTTNQGPMPMLYELTTTSGITLPQGEAGTSDSRVYNLQGQYVGTSLQGLPPGIYIRNNRKLVVR